MLRIHKSYAVESLLKDCLRGKPRAQEALYQKFAPKMLAVCLRYIADRDEAEHVMIGGMIKVFEKLSLYNGSGSLDGWVRRIMVNESLMYLRKVKSLSLEVDVSSAQVELDYHFLENHLEVEDLVKMIGELPIGYRTVFNLYAIEGYSHKEIGEMLDISENTSKSQLSRARKILKDRLVQLSEKELRKGGNHGK